MDAKLKVCIGLTKADLSIKSAQVLYEFSTAGSGLTCFALEPFSCGTACTTNARIIFLKKNLDVELRVPSARVETI